MKKQNTYKIAYNVKCGRFTESELRKNDLGGCDAIIIHSILFLEDGSRDQIIISSNEEDDSLSSLELWKSWVMMAAKLLERKDLSTGKRIICKKVFDAAKKDILDLNEKERRA